MPESEPAIFTTCPIPQAHYDRILLGRPGVLDIRRHADVCGQGCLSIRKDRTGRVAEQQRRRATRGEGLEQGIRAPVAVEITDDQCEVER